MESYCPICRMSYERPFGLHGCPNRHKPRTVAIAASVWASYEAESYAIGEDGR